MPHLISPENRQKARKIGSSKNNEPVITVIHKDSSMIAILSLIFSIVAICVPIYYQIYFEKNDTSVSFINASFDNDTLLTAHVVFNNKGNKYATILRNNIVFYQQNIDSLENNEDSAIKFSAKKAKVIFDDELDPVVLEPGQQLYRKVGQSFDFKLVNFKSKKINPKDTIKIGLIVGFLSQSGYHSSNILPMGWILLDSNFQKRKWKLDFTLKKLESNKYWSSVYSK
jgi:aromatic ring-cleaving dioxygenase